MPRANQSDTFPPASYAEWQAAVDAAAGAGNPASRVRATTSGNVPVALLYAPGGPGDAETRALAGRVAGLLGAHASWRIRQAFALGTDQGDVQDALLAGMDSLELTASSATTAAEVRDAMETHGRADLEISFSGLAPARLPPGFLAEHRGMLSLGFDPIGQALASHNSGDLEKQLGALGPHVLQANGRRVLRADGLAFGASRASDGLGRVLGAALAYLRFMDDAGGSLAYAAQGIEVRLPCESHFFRSIALLRAARLVWARILEFAGVNEPPALYLVATTSGPSTLDSQPWINALRNSVVAFAGAVGGADVIQLPPGDRLEAMASNGSRRLACTTALIAREEAYLRRVADPAEGSWFLEALTATIAHDAWNEVARLDAAGGIVAAMRSGALSA